VFLLSAPDVGSQDKNREAQEADTVPTRPAESDLLLNDQTTGETPTANPEAVNFPGVSPGDFLRVILVLVAIIVLIYALVWMLRKLTGIKAGGGDEIRIYSTRPIKGNSALHLIEAGNRVFLIGSTDNSINLISEIDDRGTIEEIRLNSSKTPASGGFAKLLKKRFSDKSSAKGENSEAGRANGYSTDASILNLRKQRERLKNL